MKLYDGTLIPANRSLSADQIATRNARLYLLFELTMAMGAPLAQMAIVSSKRKAPQMKKTRSMHVLFGNAV